MEAPYAVRERRDHGIASILILGNGRPVFDMNREVRAGHFRVTFPQKIVATSPILHHRQRGSTYLAW